jgi:hypothetical protein
MPSRSDITAPPASVLARLEPLKAALRRDLPVKRPRRNLVIGTWNLREFGRVTPKWAPGPSGSPKRCLADILAIAAVAERFDVLAIQETTRSLDALRLLKTALGEDWAFWVSNVTEGDPGNDERLAYVFDTRRVQPSGLVGELVIPDERLGVVGGGLERQFARTPYVVSFQAGSAGSPWRRCTSSGATRPASGRLRSRRSPSSSGRRPPNRMPSAAPSSPTSAGHGGSPTTIRSGRSSPSRAKRVVSSPSMLRAWPVPLLRLGASRTTGPDIA